MGVENRPGAKDFSEIEAKMRVESMVRAIADLRSNEQQNLPSSPESSQQQLVPTVLFKRPPRKIHPPQPLKSSA